MGLLTNWNFPTIKDIFSTGTESVSMPAKGGQISANSPEQMVGIPADPDKWRREQLKILNHLASINESISYAVRNTIITANTNHEITFSDKISRRQRKQMMEFINRHSASWAQGGMSGLKRLMFRNLLVSGAISIEPVLAMNRRYLQRANWVDNQYIYFIPKADGTSLISQNTGAKRVIYGDSFIYSGLDYDGISEYPTPYLLPAIDNAMLQQDMKGSFKTMVKFLGMLGAVVVSMKQPTQARGEPKEAYQKRLQDIISTQYREFQKGIAGGLTISFEEFMKLDIVGNNANTQNALNLAQILNQWMATSLKTNADMIGDNQSSTKSFGEVLLNQMVMGAREFQQVVEQSMEKLILIHLLAGGFNPHYVNLKFESPDVRDKKADAETRKIKIDTLQLLYAQGIIDNQQFAHEAGYDQPALDEPRKQETAPKPKVSEVKNALQKLTRKSLPVEYNVAEMTYEDEGTDFRDKKLNQISKRYLKAVRDRFDVATRQGLRKVKKAIDGRKFDNAEVFAVTVLNAFFENWDKDFDQKIQDPIRTNVSETYRYFRSDKRIFDPKFSKFADDDIPDSVFDLLDHRLIEYFQNADSVYLGRFIRDEETMQRFTKRLRELYIERDGEIGNDSENLKTFLEEFGDTVGGQGYKIRRIIETTLNNARGYANVKYIHQAGLTRFVRVEVMDNRTCPHCQSANGEVFEVAQEIRKAEAMVENNNPDDLPPFAVKTPIAEFRKMSPSEKQAVGVGANSLHPHCRGRIIIDGTE